MRLQLKSLCLFLQEAKRATYASGSPPVRQNFVRSYTYHSDSFDYEDRYTGNIQDVGMEIVRFHSWPLWGMSYYGGTQNRDQARTSLDVISFLREALRLMPEQFPVRGPNSYKRNNMQYRNRVNGDILNFDGIEIVTFKDRELYCRRYQGGLIKDRAYQIVIDLL